MGGMKSHLKLGALVVVLLAVAAVLVFTEGQRHRGTAPHDALHEHAEGETEAEHQHEGEEGEEQVSEKPKPQQPQAGGAPQLPPAKGKRTRVRLETSMGQIEILLYDELAPKTVKNFLDLTNKGYYRNMIFHRVVKGFVIQTGDPTGTGKGGPGYKFDNEIVPALRHNQPGVVAMANAGPNTNGSQFYITLGAAPHLDGGYSIFGQVVKGMDVVRTIDGVLTDREGRPVSPVRFDGVTVLGQE